MPNHVPGYHAYSIVACIAHLYVWLLWQQVSRLKYIKFIGQYRTDAAIDFFTYAE
jgi:hypothetical protein